MKSSLGGVFCYRIVVAAVILGTTQAVAAGLEPSGKAATLDIVRISEKQDSRPNIVFILADDLGWGDLGCYRPLIDDGPDAETATPNLDRLATSGVRFTNGYANHLVCAPSRAGILTGRTQARLGYFAFEDSMADFPQDAVLLPEALKTAGYRTGMMGKWHISYREGSKPLDRGFDRFFGFLGGEHDYFEPNVGQPIHRINHARYAFVYDQHEPVKKMDYLTDELTSQALDFISAVHEEKNPFFLYLAYNAPHAPLQVSWEYLKPFADKRPEGKFTKRDIARAIIMNLDWNVGRLMDFFEGQGLRGNTLVFFASDNGAAQQCYAGGLRGRKGFFYEGGIRVPLIASWPGTIPAGQVVDEPVITHDIYKTSLGAAGIAGIPDGVEGVDWMPHIAGKQSAWPTRQLLWTLEDKNIKWAIREGRWKLINDDTVDRFGAWPFVEIKGKQKEIFKTQLYDLDADPQEHHDLSGQYPEVVERLQKAMDALHTQVPSALATPAVNARAQEMMREQLDDPKKYPKTIKIEGAPGHWSGQRNVLEE